jgi:TolB protein
MKKNLLRSIKIFLSVFIFAASLNFAISQDQNPLNMNEQVKVLGNTKPIPVSLDGFSGEVESVLKFDLYVQGFSFVTPDAAQYQISGSNSGNVIGRVSDKFAKKEILSRSYTGSNLRRQAHAFADDIVLAITGKKGIAQTKIAFKSQSENGDGEIYVSDFDGGNPQAVTHEKTIVSAPAWVPGRLAIYYNSYRFGNPDIFYNNLATGEARVIARYGGSNISPAPSPDGSKVAMILDKDGWVDLYVADADGSNLKRLTKSPEDESSPCWSPDGKWICFATKIAERRVLAKISADGGAVQRISTAGVSNPTEPDWSPDGKWIAFTSQMGDFNICVIPADGSASPTVLVMGEDPSWSPNSRTLVFTKRAGWRYTLSVLDVFTKQVKDISRISGNDSQPSWAK